MTHLLATELLAKSGSGGGGGSPIGFLVIIVIFAVVYIVFLRPARSRSKKNAAQRNKAEVGDRVTTTAGLIATVVAINDDEVTLEVAPGVYSQYLPAAILRVMDPPETYEHDGHDDLNDEADGDDASEAHGESEQPPVVDEPTDS